LFLLCSFSLHSSAVCNAAPIDAGEVVKTWVRDANATQTFRIKLKGVTIRPTDQLGDIPVNKQQSEAELTRIVEYWFKRDGNSERYYRSAIGPSPKGLIPTELTLVHSDQTTRELIPGSSGLNEFDEFQMRNENAVSDWEVNALRILLNLTHSGTTYFDQSEFSVLPNSQTTIDKSPCLILESQSGRGTRIWFEQAAPFRIRRIEDGYLQKELSGLTEYRFDYETRVSTDQPSPLSQVSAIEVFRFDPSGQLIARIESNVESLDFNPSLPTSLFQLEPPPGSIIGDYTQNPPGYFIQLADGTARTLKKHERKLNNFYRLSATVDGSRVEGKALPMPPGDVAGNKGDHRLMLLVINAIALAAIVILFLVTKKMKSHSNLTGEES
jgi:hypothetical protein